VRISSQFSIIYPWPASLCSKPKTQRIRKGFALSHNLAALNLAQCGPVCFNPLSDGKGACPVFERREIYCHIRFSFFGITDTRLKPEDHDDAQRLLYNETRMARRFFLFENLTLPSLRAQTDRDFKIVIMSSDIMPDRFKDRLRALTAGDANVIIDFSDRRNGAFAFRPHIDASLGEGLRKTAVHFRLDDDDALASTYIARLRMLTHGLSIGTHVTFPSGLTVFPLAAGSDAGAVMPHRQFLIGLGLAIVCGGTFRKNPFQMMHGDVWQRWPVVSDPTLQAYIRSYHFDNDTLASQDRVLAAQRAAAVGPGAEETFAHVDSILADGFSFITQAELAGLVGQVQAITSLDDLPKI
jgi:hypothetical protein